MEISEHNSLKEKSEKLDKNRGDISGNSRMITLKTQRWQKQSSTLTPLMGKTSGWLVSAEVASSVP
jgi:hypothetical protein